MHLKEAMTKARTDAFVQAIQWSGGNISAAAAALGVRRAHAHKVIKALRMTGLLRAIRAHPTAANRPPRPAPLEETMLAANRAAYKTAIKLAGGDIADAAGLLGVAPTSVYEAIDRLDITDWLREIRARSGWFDRSVGKIGVPRGPGERTRAI